MAWFIVSPGSFAQNWIRLPFKETLPLAPMLPMSLARLLKNLRFPAEVGVIRRISFKVTPIEERDASVLSVALYAIWTGPIARPVYYPDNSRWV